MRGDLQRPDAKRGTSTASQNAKLERRARNDDGWWLRHRAIPFEPCLVLAPTARAVADRMLDDLLVGCRFNRRGKWVEALSVLLANLTEAWGPEHLKGGQVRTRAKRPVRISRDEKAWSGPKRYDRLAHVIELMDHLHEKGYIGMKMGYYFKGQDRNQTRIWALPKLLSTHRELLCATVTIQPPTEPVELYERRERKTDKRKLIKYRDTEFTRRVRKILRAANEVNGQAVIEYDDGDERQRVLSYMKAIFLGSFTLYGRLHTYGCRHAQGLSKYDRETITINGECVIEKDFSALHPRLLYAAQGIEFDDDPYTVVVHKLFGPKGDARGGSCTLRSFLKVALLALLNANDFQHAERATNYWLYENDDERRDLRVLGVTRARPVLEAFMETHGRIAHHFCSGKLNGLRTMNKDARIALDIVWQFARQGVPIIPIHDSFIVPAQHADELESTMKAAYQKHTDGFSCPIK